MLAIASGKGGSGKTTTTLGLATALPGRTLAVDFDSDMPDLHALAGAGRDGERPDPGDRMPHPTEEGVELVPASGGDDRHDATLSRLAREDATVLLDCPAGAGPDAATPLRAADGVLLVSTLCLPALRDTAKTAAMARALDTPVVGSVLTRSRLSPAAVERILGCPVLTSIPEVAPPVLDAAAVRSAYLSLATVVQSEGLL